MFDTRILTIALFLFSQATWAGVGGGNTELFRPRNAQGELIEIQFSAEHPLANKLLDLVRKADLPTILKNEMLGDLTSTAIMYSNEVVTYADTQRQLQLVLTKMVRTKTKNADGTTSESTHEEYSPAEAASELGIYVTPMNMVLKGLNDSYVAAYTQSEPRRVVYFTPFLKKMTEDETLALVLHEQAHRLRVLARFQGDERFIDGWCSTLLNYLEGRINKSAILEILANNGIHADPTGGIEGEHYVAATGLFTADINVTISPEDLTFRGVLNGRYALQVNSRVFHAYPNLQKQAELFEVAALSGLSNSGYESMERFFHNTLDAGKPTSLPLRLVYKKTITTDSLGRDYSSITLTDWPTYFPVTQSDEINRTGTGIATRHLIATRGFWFHALDTSAQDGPYQALYNDSRQYADLLTLLTRLDQAFSDLETASPTLTKLIHNLNLGLSLAIAEGAPTGLSLQAEAHSLALTVNPNDVLGSLSVADLKAQLVAIVSDKPLDSWIALEPANKLLTFEQVLLAPDASSAADLAGVAQVFVKNPGLLKYLDCLATYTDATPSESRAAKFVLTVGTNEAYMTWRFSTFARFSVDSGLNLALTFPRALVQSDPETAGDRALSWAFTKSSLITGGIDLPGQVLWSTETKRYSMYRAQTGVFAGSIQNLFSACTNPNHQEIPAPKPKRSGD